MQAFESVSTWRQPVPAPASAQRTALIATVAGWVAALGPGRLRVGVDGLTGAGKTSFGHELAAQAARLHRDRYHTAEMIYLAEVDPKSLADVIIDNRDFKRP